MYTGTHIFHAWPGRAGVLSLCPQPSGAHCLGSFLWIRTPRFRDTMHLTQVVAEALQFHGSCSDDPVASRVKVCLSWKTRKQLSKITLNLQENKGEMEEGWVSLVDMFEVKFLLPFLGGRHANKFRKLSRYASSLGIVAAHGNVGKPCCPGETVRCWRSCEMIEKNAVLPRSQSLLP